jgi:hypothetical protein
LYKDLVNGVVLNFSFANKVIGHGNKLPGKVINVSSINSLKIELDKYLRAREGINE